MTIQTAQKACRPLPVQQAHRVSTPSGVQLQSLRGCRPVAGEFLNHRLSALGVGPKIITGLQDAQPFRCHGAQPVIRNVNVQKKRLSLGVLSRWGKPMGKAHSQIAQVFCARAHRLQAAHASSSGVVRDHRSDVRIQRPGHQGGFAATGVPCDSDALSIKPWGQCRDGLNDAPGPHRDGRPGRFGPMSVDRAITRLVKAVPSQLGSIKLCQADVLVQEGVDRLGLEQMRPTAVRTEQHLTTGRIQRVNTIQRPAQPSGLAHSYLKNRQSVRRAYPFMNLDCVTAFIQRWQGAIHGFDSRLVRRMAIKKFIQFIHHSYKR